MKTVKIESLLELQRKMPRILQAVNADKSLAIAASANPLLALAELGYELAPEAQREIKIRARFGEEIGQKVVVLEEQIREVGGDGFPLEDIDLLLTVLKERLAERLHKSKQAYGKSEQRIPAKIEECLSKPQWAFNSSVSIEREEWLAWKELDPILPLVVEYWQLQWRYPPFANEEAFQQLREGKVKMPFSAIHFSLQDTSRRKKYSL